MPSPPFKSRRKTLVVLSLIVFTSVAFGDRHWRAKNSPLEDRSSIPLRVMNKVAPQKNSAVRVEAEVLTLRPAGFNPKQITRPPGHFLLVFENRSGIQDLTVQLSLENNSARIISAPISRRVKGLRQLVDLPVGRYVLSVADHPQWTCVINIVSH